MPSSPAKIRANRANARRSTGPRTAAGKRRSRYNAKKEGWSGEMPVPVGENLEVFQELRGQIVRTFSAVTAPERFLCSRIALALWRSTRATRAEAASIAERAATFMENGYDEDDPAATALVDSLDPARFNGLAQLVRYERHLTREARDAVSLLKVVQAARVTRVTGQACTETGDIVQGEPAAVETAVVVAPVPKPVPAASEPPGVQPAAAGPSADDRVPVVGQDDAHPPGDDDALRRDLALLEACAANGDGAAISPAASAAMDRVSAYIDKYRDS